MVILKETEMEIEFSREKTKLFTRIIWAVKIILGFKTKIKVKVKEE